MSELTHLLTDPAHMAFEVLSTLIIEGIGAGIAWPFIKRRIRKHDKDVHQVTSQ